MSSQLNSLRKISETLAKTKNQGAWLKNGIIEAVFSSLAVPERRKKNNGTLQA